MSTIASPREPSLSGRRIPLLSTPTSSSRPSLETPRPNANDSNPPSSSNPVSQLPANPPKRNRAALREYYNLQSQSQSQSQRAAAAPSTASQAPSSPTSSSIHSFHNDIPDSEWGELDREGFDAAGYVRRVLEEKSLAEVLAIYRGVLGEVRSLEGERKALVYDNYSKLIVATEMIGRMREGVASAASGKGKSDGKETGNVGRLNEKGKGKGGGDQGDGVEGVEELVERVRKAVEGLRREGEEVERREREERARRARTRRVVERVLGAPGRVRELVKEGKTEEARAYWGKERALLERWRERGVGGEDVGLCLDEGEDALRGEDTTS
ncbi:hypothetical protein MBM_03015 [Drepanopeziza brunnea f. sp. 'multigermtubi' MB_m1]|uniref:Vacuolar protein sorting-associated protein 51 homolog n=1 Tax=Marssonina brunnea f. sp. multigermtubi (strain MB_m1) TaxID=1072389 RepID=K1XD70_MARBU|nr:uncharacterized protein MBM_03015 [Drepanopeziza brunnea f. sp. 'multigermtubi' MB_m1]EKD18773.1 hypothetical protein MBM_03015 [Drepanopeziza brunnea f. sp. 'multigermtubi' MB_m1]